MSLYVIHDSEGRLVGTVPSGVQEVKTSLPGVQIVVAKEGEEQSGEILQVEIVPEALPGQTVHEVELPQELQGLEGLDLHNALMGFRVKTAEAKLVQLRS
jgi:hypothetical protein